MRDVCVRTELRTCCLCWDRTTNVLMLRVQNYECAACASTGAVSAYTKRGIEILFPGTQMFVQPRSKKCPQHTAKPIDIGRKEQTVEQE